MTRIRERLTQIWYRLRMVVYLSYFRLAHANYERRWVAPRKRTPGGTVRSYELYNRHGRDAMLAELVSVTGPADTVYDVGANVGVYALALAAEAPDRRVVAFEPAPPSADRLRANVHRNDFDDRIEIRACGLGDTDGNAPFYRSTYSELSAFDRESATRWEASVADIVSVPVRRLDSLDDCPPPDVLKIDVEGTAPAVLRGARETLARHRPILLIEVHTDALSTSPAGAVRSLLDELDYSIRERATYWRCEPLESAAG